MTAPGTVLRSRAARTALLAALALPAAGGVPARATEQAVVIHVERVRPRHEDLRTLRFLQDNRAFFRSRLDLLREQVVARNDDAREIDPRFLAYREMLRELMSARDSVGAAEDQRQRRDLFASVSELSALEAQLDNMDRLLADQRRRLAALQEDFNGRQRTELAVVISGYPHDAALSAISIRLEDGDTLSVPISAEERASLERGGVLQVFHGLVEPRPQVVEVALAGGPWPGGESGFVSLEPPRDRITFLRLDLSPVRPAGGAAGMLASTWLHDAEVHPGDSTTPEP